MARPTAPSSPTPRLASEADANGAIEPINDPRLASLVPEQLLQPGELIILLLKPSIWSVVLDSLASLVAIAVGAFVAVKLIEFDWITRMSRRDVMLIAVGLAGIRLTWQFLEWLSRTYVLTDRRVVRIKGFVRVQVFEAPLKQIQHTTTTFSVRERLLGLGTIHFATAGTHVHEASWQMLAAPLDVHQTVVQTLNRYR
jgi:uncharacterized membrane protein YdbT with pleckstrin-like domain